MTTTPLDAVGLCAHPSPTGDRAFRYALSFAKAQGLQLNVFTFLPSPWLPVDGPIEMSDAERAAALIEADRRVRLYYEDRFGDFIDVGFRVCEGRKEVELRRCLKRREYQVLVVPYFARGGPFGDLPVEEFAYRFTSPVVLVGPWRKVRYWLNPPAALIVDRLHLYEGTWRVIPRPETSCALAEEVRVP